MKRRMHSGLKFIPNPNMYDRSVASALLCYNLHERTHEYTHTSSRSLTDGCTLNAFLIVRKRYINIYEIVIKSDPISIC